MLTDMHAGVRSSVVCTRILLLLLLLLLMTLKVKNVVWALYKVMGFSRREPIETHLG